MVKYYTIIKDNIIIGRFIYKEDRDKAFEEYILKTSDNCFKGEE